MDEMSMPATIPAIQLLGKVGGQMPMGNLFPFGFPHPMPQFGIFQNTQCNFQFCLVTSINQSNHSNDDQSNHSSDQSNHSNDDQSNDY